MFDVFSTKIKNINDQKKKKTQLKPFFPFFNFTSCTLRHVRTPQVIASVRRTVGRDACLRPIVVRLVPRFPAETEQYYASSRDNSGRAYQRGAASVQTITERKTNVTRYVSPIALSVDTIIRHAQTATTQGVLISSRCFGVDCGFTSSPAAANENPTRNSRARR